jgi:hypothetical protein
MNSTTLHRFEESVTVILSLRVGNMPCEVLGNRWFCRLAILSALGLSPPKVLDRTLSVSGLDLEEDN